MSAKETQKTSSGEHIDEQNFIVWFLFLLLMIILRFGVFTEDEPKPISPSPQFSKFRESASNMGSNAFADSHWPISQT